MQIRPMSAALGAEVTGVDLADLNERDFQQLYDAWLQGCVLVVRGQSLTESSLVSFSRRFGDLELPPASESRVTGDGGASSPEIWTISNVRVNGEPIGALGSLEADWHSDMSYRSDPPAASVLYARELPASGANTCFSNMYAACLDLPERLKAQIATLHVRHDSAYTSVGTLRADARAVEDVSEVEGAIHPSILKHPETGREALFMGRRLNASFVELPTEASERLLDEVWGYCTDPQFVYEHVWALGDLVIWDNRCTLHRRDAFDDRERRVMWRTQIKNTHVGIRPR